MVEMRGRHRETREAPVDKQRPWTGVAAFWHLACKNTQLPEP